jgi:hypothetical protein
VTVIGSGEAAAEAIRRKEHGWGMLGALEETRRQRAEMWGRVRKAVEDGTMGRREAQDARHKAARRQRRLPLGVQPARVLCDCA